MRELDRLKVIQAVLDGGAADVEAYGVERWLGEMALALRQEKITDQTRGRAKNLWAILHSR
jgi:hypothetical protein